MRSIPLFLALWFVALAASAGDALIVKKNGESIIAKNCEPTATRVRYADADGTRQELPLADVEAVLPRLLRGQTYPPDEVKKTIALIRQTETKFRKLEKQIRPLLDEWLAFERQTTTPGAQASLQTEIDQLFAAYAQGPQDPPAFARLNSELGMLKFKDVKGECGPALDARLADLRTQFLAAQVARLEQLAAKPAPSVADYQAARELATNLTPYQPPADQAKQIETLAERTRLACLSAETALARQAFTAARNLGGYLQGNGRLVALERQVAREPERAALVRLRQEWQAALPGCEFRLKGFEDYPLTAADKQSLATFRVFRTIVPETPEPLAAALIPVRFPPPLKLAAPYSLAVRLVFRTPPPPKLGLLLQPSNTLMVCPEVKVVNAHAEVTFRCDLSKLAPAALAELNQKITNERGQKVMTLMAVRCWTDAQGAPQWTPISWALPLLVE